MIKPNDYVYYAQQELFDQTFVGKQGRVTMIINRSPEMPQEALVYFFELGNHKVPLHCLELSS